MKKKLSIALLTLSLALTMSACNGVSQEDYDKLASEKEDIQKELDTNKEALEQLQSDYDTYKEKMKPYEEMEVAEAEARKLAAEKKKEEEEAAAAKKKEKEEAAAKKKAEEKEKKGYDTGITYDQLARTPDDYLNEKVKFKGTVLQVLESDSEIQIRLAVNDDYDDVLYCAYDPSIVSSRVLEDDTITIYGSSLGLYSYESTMGGTITIPAVYIDKIDQ